MSDATRMFAGEAVPTDRDGLMRAMFDDFGVFLRALWIETRSTDYVELGDIEIDIARWAGYTVRHGGPKRRGILAYRGIGKTYSISAAMPLWYLFRDREARVQIITKSRDAARDIIKLTRAWIKQCWFLQHLDPDQNKTADKKARDNVDAFDVFGSRPSKDASVMAYGIGSSITGKRAHLIIVDDVEQPGNTETDASRERLRHSVREFGAIATYGYGDEHGHDVGGEILYVGTYHTEDSLYVRLADEDGVQFRSWPAEYSNPDDLLGMAPMLADRVRHDQSLVGQPTNGHRHSRQWLDARLSGSKDTGDPGGRRWYDQQYRLIKPNRSSTERRLRLDDLIVMDVPTPPGPAPARVVWARQDRGEQSTVLDIPCLGVGTERLYAPAFKDKPEHWTEYQRTIMFIDPSGRGTDRTGVAVVSSLAGMLFVHDVLGLEGGFEDEKDMTPIARLARERCVSRIYVEDNFGRGMYQALLQPAVQRHFVGAGDEKYPNGWACSFEAINAWKQKELRILETLEPVMSTHRLVIDTRAITPTVEGDLEDELQFQIARIRNTKGCLSEDGKLDALAGAVAALQGDLSVIPERASANAMKRESEVLEAYIANLRAANGPPRPPASVCDAR